MYVFPAGRKMPPFPSYTGPAKASEMLAYIQTTVSSQFNIKLNKSEEELGSREKDIKMFQERLEMEGIIKLAPEEVRNEHEEL